MTDEYVIIQCTNLKCKRFICLLDDCFETFITKYYVAFHQGETHRIHSRPDQCYTCKAPKGRETRNHYGECPICGVYWCLDDECHCEMLFLGGIHAHQTRHPIQKGR